MGLVQCIMVKLTPLLTVKQNGSVTVSKHKATHEKGNTETGSDHALPVYRMLWNCLEDSKEFNQPGVGYKSRSHHRIRKD